MSDPRTQSVCLGESPYAFLQRAGPYPIMTLSPNSSAPSAQRVPTTSSGGSLSANLLLARKSFDLASPELYARVRLSVKTACPAWLLPECDDLAQKAMLRLMERSERNHNQVEFCASYIYRAAHNTVIDEIRRRRREVKMQALDPAVQEHADPTPPTGHIDDSIIRDAIFHCLGKIRAERRIAISMKLQGHSTADIGRLLAWNNKRVENLTSRGRQDLKLCLQKKGIHGTCPK